MMLTRKKRIRPEKLSQFSDAEQLLYELLRARRGNMSWEETIARLNRRDTFRKLLFGLIAAGVIMLAGNRLTVRQTNRFWDEACGWLISQPRRRNRIRRALNRYAKERTVIFVEDRGTTIIQLTATGRRTIQRYNWENLVIERPARWDGRWRVVLFDIPESQRVARDLLRAKLQALGFVFIQKSAWVNPFPCEHIIASFRELYEVGSCVTTLIAEGIDNEDRLRRKFQLHS
jgi:hypothetical protein